MLRQQSALLSCSILRLAHFNVLCIYRVGQKTGPQTHDHNCAKSEPIYKIFTLEDFSVNLQLNEC